MSTATVSSRTPAEIYARRNVVDPVDPVSFLRRSEKLAVSRKRLGSLALQIDDEKRLHPLVCAPDRQAYSELINVATQALQSAAYIIDAATVEIEQEMAK